MLNSKFLILIVVVVARIADRLIKYIFRIKMSVIVRVDCNSINANLGIFQN